MCKLEKDKVIQNHRCILHQKRDKNVHQKREMISFRDTTIKDAKNQDE